MNPGTGAEDETASEVTNNVLSNFASIMPDEAQEIELGVYTKDEEPVAYDYATIEMPFNKQAVSKKTLRETTCPRRSSSCWRIRSCWLRSTEARP